MLVLVEGELADLVDFMGGDGSESKSRSYGLKTEGRGEGCEDSK